MEVNTIYCTKREAVGSHASNRLRAEGMVPAVVYGRGNESVSLTLPGHTIEQELRKHHRVFVLSVDGAEQPVYLKDVQIDAITDQPLHVDFLRIAMDQPIALEVELVYIGNPKGATKGGSLVFDRTRMAVLAMPDRIPHELQVNVANVDVGDQITAGDLKLPDGVQLNCPPNTRLCRMPE